MSAGGSFQCAFFDDAHVRFNELVDLALANLALPWNATAEEYGEAGLKRTLPLCSRKRSGPHDFLQVTTGAHRRRK